MSNIGPIVSVIIPCFNQGAFVDEAVESVLDQTFKDFEIIIVNDGSTDEYTLNKLKNYNKPKCKVIHTINQGPSTARNTAILAALGKYILPLDADDRIGPGYLEEASKILDKEIEIGIVYSETEFFGTRKGKWNLPCFSIEKILVINMITCCAMFRKVDYLKTSGYNPNMKYGFEDWDFWLSLIELGIGVYKIPDVYFYYRIGNTNSRLTTLNQSLEKRKHSLNTIYLNHLGFYMDNMDNPIELYLKLNKLLLSKDYKTGRLIINPFRKIKKVLKKILM